MAKTLNNVLTQAVSDIESHGYDSQNRVDYWIKSILAIANQYKDADMLVFHKELFGAPWSFLHPSNRHHYPTCATLIQPQMMCGAQFRI